MSDCLTKVELAQAYKELKPSAEVQARIEAWINAVAKSGGVSTLTVCVFELIILVITSSY